MKAVVAAFNQEKALVGAFSEITNLRICFGCNFLKHYMGWWPGQWSVVPMMWPGHQAPVCPRCGWWVVGTAGGRLVARPGPGACCLLSGFRGYTLSTAATIPHLRSRGDPQSQGGQGAAHTHNITLHYITVQYSTVQYIHTYIHTYIHHIT